MAGDFFSEIAKAWQEGWNSSANMPSLGPKVGRGLFSSWGMSERDRELAELVDLHARLEARQDALLEGPLENRFELITEVLGGAWHASDAHYSGALAEALFDLIDHVLIEECYWYPRYDDPHTEIAALPMRTRVDLRSYLLRREQLFDLFDKRLPLLKGLLLHMCASVLDAVAERSAIDDEHAADAVALEVPIAGMIENPADVMDDWVREVCSESGPAFMNELFVDCRTQLMTNLALASNINPQDPAPTRPYILPADARFDSPAELAETYLRHTPFQDLLEAPVPVFLPDELRCEHALIVGGSGHGKTQLLLKLIHHDLVRGADGAPGVIVIDSQGDLIQTISRLALFDPDLAEGLADRLVLIDPSDVEFPVALNLFAFDHDRLEGYSRADRERVLNSVIDLYEYFFAALLGAELTQKQGVVFRYLARLMMVIPDATVQTLRALMEDGKPFKPYMQKLDGSAKRFFQTEFFAPSFSATKKQILRRLWGVLANPVFERMFSHPRNKLDVFEAMNAGKIILINTAKDLLKADGCSIFGRFFIAKIAQASLERATLEEDARRRVHVYIDEAHDYFDETLEQLFNQARKYRVGLHIAAQHLDQMPTRLRSTVMASTSIKFAGGVSAKDARAMAEDMRVDADMIQSMRKRRDRTEFAVYAKGVTEEALRMDVQLGLVNTQASLDDEAFCRLLDQNRGRYCSTLDEIEALIEAADMPDDQPAPEPEQPTRPTEKQAPSPTKRAKDPPSAPDHTARPKKPDAPGDEARSDPAKKDAAPKENVRETRKEEIDAYAAGVGGRQHKRLQQWVRELAQTRGFKATVEQTVLDGSGSVDVGLEHEKLSIAVEISVSNTADAELRNVEKCFRAGFDEVVLIVPDVGRRTRYRAHIQEHLDQANTKSCSIIGPDELIELINARAAKLTVDETVVRGWKVTTRYTPVSEEEAKHRRETVAKIIALSANKPPQDAD
jgi:hypothetical protein